MNKKTNKHTASSGSHTQTTGKVQWNSTVSGFFLVEKSWNLYCHKSNYEIAKIFSSSSLIWVNNFLCNAFSDTEMYSCNVRLLNNSLKINHHLAQSSTCVFSNDANNNFGQLNKKIQEVEAEIILSGKNL